MSAGMKVTKDRVAQVSKALREMTLNHVLIGVPSDKAARKAGEDHGPMDNPTIGYMNENGSAAANIPPRPHLIPGVEAVSERTSQILAKGAKEALEGNEGAVDKAMNSAGLVAQASVKNTLKAGAGWAPLADSTIAARKKRGFAGEKPLIWTGQYMNSITYVIRKR